MREGKEMQDPITPFLFFKQNFCNIIYSICNYNYKNNKATISSDKFEKPNKDDQDVAKLVISNLTDDHNSLP